MTKPDTKWKSTLEGELLVAQRDAKQRGIIAENFRKESNDLSRRLKLAYAERNEVVARCAALSEILLKKGYKSEDTMMAVVAARMEKTKKNEEEIERLRGLFESVRSDCYEAIGGDDDY